MKSRVIGLDIIRCVALIFVFCIHFILYSDFYSTDLNGFGMFLISCFRWLVFNCIPLFLLLTGYLNNNTKFDKDYFYKLFKILISYIIIGIMCLLFKNIYLGQNISIIDGMVSLLNFSADDYAWYVEMYVGLFLIIPFLNILYKHLKTKENRMKLLIALFIVFSLTATLKVFYPPKYTFDIFSDYWKSAYPLLYFFFGKFLHDYPLKSKNRKLLFELILLILIQSGIIFIAYKYYTSSFDLIGYYNLFTVAESIIIFTLLSKINLKNKLCTKMITNISLVSFEMYLISAPIDLVFYNKMNFNFNNTLDYLLNFIVSLPVIIISTFILGFIINKISRFIYVKFKPLYDKICLFFSKKFDVFWKKLVK